MTEHMSAPALVLLWLLHAISPLTPENVSNYYCSVTHSILLLLMPRGSRR